MDQPYRIPVEPDDDHAPDRLLSEDIEPLLRDYYRLRLLAFLRDYNYQRERAMRVRLANEQRSRSRRQGQRTAAGTPTPAATPRPVRLRWGLLLLGLLISLAVGAPLVASIDPPPALAFAVGALWTVVLVWFSRR